MPAPDLAGKGLNSIASKSVEPAFPCLRGQGCPGVHGMMRSLPGYPSSLVTTQVL
jgi:hypothetical protein